ncbi:hypothetical protein SANBI_001408 [Sanguibacter sp. 4.1]|uniref:DUF7507 domain-containing protein n=1 Tax=Sanguibacter biliveldensis TaxID=3030830 RepID=A0AAF0ZBM5_9MICO|nr:hypothetical protein [Sanguibacter sp. 4.1]WPF83713.1 hypothetical protein SANBI_001408 [Sanguibacter sp. 4.1]
MAMLNAFAFSVPRAEAVPAGSEYPASWTIAGNVATGTTPSGVVVTATLTGPVTFAGSGGLVFGGPSPAFFPPTTTEALQFINTTCTSTAPSGCGSITYAFSEPVTTPVFYTGDIGSGVISASNPPTFSEYRNTPQTLTSGGTFSLDTPGSQTSNVAITNGGTTVGIINPAGRVGTAASTNSCDPAGFGCGTYAISTPTPTVESITIGFSNAGVGVEGDAFTQVVGITPLTPSISMTKTVSPQTISAAGQELAYSFAVSNTGNTALSGVSIAETAFSGTGEVGAIVCDVTTLAIGGTTTCSATYTATQADVDAGTISNTATASGDTPGGETVTSPESSAEVTAAPAPALTVVKSVDPAGQDSYEVGQELTYSFLVTNSGNVTMTDVTVNEGEFDGTGELGAITPASVATLAPGDSTTFTATYTLTQADVDRGSTTNTATATGIPPTGPPVESPPSTVEIPSIAAPALTVVKSVDPAGQESYEVGQELTYSFLVTNSGNVTMTDVTVNEGEFDGTGELGAITPASVATLAPGDSTTFTATYTLTQADVDRGSTTNTATATGVPPTGPPVESPPSTVEIPSIAAPALTVVKSADLTEITAAGQVVRYSFVVTNTGNVTVTDAAPVETEFSGTGDLGAVTPESATLIPGQSATFTADYAVTQADVDGGVLTNTATAGGTPPPGTELPPVPPSTVEIPSIAAPALTVLKSVDPAGQESYEVGQELTYSFLVTNSGNVTMTDVTVNEGEFDGTGELGAITPASVATLAPGDSTTFTATYTLTQADVDRGSTTNTATATGVPPTGPPVESPPSTVEIPSIAAPALTIVKTANQTVITRVGQTITYSFLVTNTGNVTVSDVDVVEGAFTGSGQLGAVTPESVATLLPGASTTFTATYVVTQADLSMGSLSNTATATAVPPGGSPVTSPPSTVQITVNVPAAPPSPGNMPPLAQTGAGVAGVVGIGVILVLGGAGLTLAARRRRGDEITAG